MIDALTFIILCFATYRITRFLIHDTLMGMGPGKDGEPVTAVARAIDSFAYDESGKDRSFLRGKVGDLLTCHYCLSFWVSTAALALWTWSLPWTVESPSVWVLLDFAIAGTVSLVYEFIDREPPEVNIYNPKG